MQTVPYILGISHPTGFPTFVFAGWIVGHLVPLGTVAWRMNVLSGAAMALAAWCVYATVVELEGKRWLGAFAAILFGVGDVAWTRGSRAEVHSFLIAFAALTVWLVVRWRRTGQERMLLAAGLAYGLALATHGLAVLMAPGLVLLLFPRIREVRLRTLLHAAGHVVVPCLLYAYIPLRSGYLYAHRVDPTLSLGLPPGRPFWDGQHPANFGAFLRYMAGGDSSAVGGSFGAMFNFVNYESVSMRFGTAAVHEFGFVAVVFALLGLAMLVRTDWFLALGLVVTCTPCIPFGLLYPEADPERYLLTAFWLAAVLTAVGVSRVTVACLGHRDVLADALGLGLMLAFALGIFRSNVHDFDSRRDNGPTQLVDHTIEHTPDNAILIAHWAYGTSLGYAAYVERRLGNRIVVIGWSSQFKAFYASWLKSRPLYMVNQTFENPDFKVRVISNDPLLVQVLSK
jgi:4-amino-4-deoxy-L-arabinose transferase-like glycosyltransferase